MRLLRFACLGLVAVGAMHGQHVISAKSGMIHYTMGKAYLKDALVTPKATEFPEMKDGDVLRTEAGRAEVLLTPGVFLRIAENSSVRMLTNALEDTRLELLAGSALLEVGEVIKDQSIVLKVGGTTLEFPKRGLFRVDFEPARVRVHSGQMVAVAGDQPVTIREGRQALLAGVISPEKFNKELGDEFHRWAARRSGYIATVNLAAVKNMGNAYGGWKTSSWLWNPYFGAFTYIPGYGRYITPFGWVYYNPRTYYADYYRPMYNDSWAASQGGGGFAGGGMRGAADMGGHSSSAVYSGPTSTATAGSAASTAGSSSGRGADTGSSRQSSSGR